MADAKKSINDMEALESAFLSKSQRLNKKRQEQMIKRVEQVQEQLEYAFENGNIDQINSIINGLKIPSSKEWHKLIKNLVLKSIEGGAIRAQLEYEKLAQKTNLNESIDVEFSLDWTLTLGGRALEYVLQYAYEVGVITEETVREQIRKAVISGLERGDRGRDLMANIIESVGFWMGQKHAETIARTETTKFYNAGKLARWLDPELDGFVVALQYDAITDSRTTDLCSELNGKIINVYNQSVIQQYTPPNHFNCRSQWLPVSKYEDYQEDWIVAETPPEGFSHNVNLPSLLSSSEGIIKKN
ncbi:minor head protein [Bacillus phage Blastoid]|uniref:Minor head protein n=1 Tax=Bacillus phage Blastoid TaxID=2880540 RepID=U5PW38_9CAUD|nr:head morphogenesis [Bacillus phage Blastoid]AGY46812.1 minor head protein [Bacillus phage Blastoid]